MHQLTKLDTQLQHGMHAHAADASDKGVVWCRTGFQRFLMLT